MLYGVCYKTNLNFVPTTTPKNVLKIIGSLKENR